MRHRFHRSFALAGLVILSLALGCKGEDTDTSAPAPAVENVPSPPPPGRPPRPGGGEVGFRRNPDLRAASAILRKGDVAGAQQRYQAVLDAARQSGDAESERGALLGLARIQACQGEKDAARQSYDELWSGQAAAGSDLTRFWDSLSTGLTYSGLGDEDKARESFERAVQVLEDAPKKQPWFEAAQLFPRWMLQRAGDTAAEAEVQQAVQTYKGNYQGPQVPFLRLEQGNLKACGWDQQAAAIEAFAQELGLDQDQAWAHGVGEAPQGPPPGQ
jgi:tetratricopeptide (TPR) repeat protein